MVDPENGDDIVALRADALAETSAMPTAHAEVTAAIRAAVLTSLREYYQPHAVANYASAADYYDGLAQKFTAAADLVDPETDAAAMVDEPEKLRRAWSSAEQLAHRLTAALAGLSAAASLAGVPIDQEHLIALTIDVTGCHRRKVWSAWETEGTTHRTLGCAARGRCHAARRSTSTSCEPYRTAPPDGGQADPDRPRRAPGAVRPRGRGAGRNRQQLSRARAEALPFTRVRAGWLHVNLPGVSAQRRWSGPIEAGHSVRSGHHPGHDRPSTHHRRTGAMVVLRGPALPLLYRATLALIARRSRDGLAAQPLLRLSRTTFYRACMSAQRRKGAAYHLAESRCNGQGRLANPKTS